MKNKLSPLEQLRYEKEELETLFAEQEMRISDKFSYLGNHWGGMLMRSIFSPKHSGSGTSAKASGIISNITNSSTLPVVWNFVQPYLIGMATNKVKGFFFNRKKKK
jgi:hypothetical protein